MALDFARHIIIVLSRKETNATRKTEVALPRQASDCKRASLSMNCPCCTNRRRVTAGEMQEWEADVQEQARAVRAQAESRQAERRRSRQQSAHTASQRPAWATRLATSSEAAGAGAGGGGGGGGARGAA